MSQTVTNSKASEPRRGSEPFWVPSILLLAQFLTITPVLLIIFANEQQRQASESYITILDGLNRLSFAVADLKHGAHSGDPEWQDRNSEYRGELGHILSNPAAAGEIRDALERLDSKIQKIPENGAADAASAVRPDLLTLERLVRAKLAKTGSSMTRMTAYLKVLVSGACLLLFGVVLVIRKFRRDAEIEGALQRNLRTTNQEVIAALGAARAESEAKNQFLASAGAWIKCALKAVSDGTESAESLGKTAEQVVEYSRIESGIFELRSIEFEPAQVVADLEKMFRNPAESKGLKLVTDTRGLISRTVRGDPERLRDVLSNLISNAIRFTEKGSVWIRAEETGGAEERPCLRFEVRDSGIGIADDVRSLFQPFSAKPGARQATGGMGLGLAISKKLVELMGGKLDVSSQSGRGSTFWFTALFDSSDVVAELPPQNGPSTRAEEHGEALPAPNPAKTNARGRLERRKEARYGNSYPTLLRSEQAGVAVIRILDVSTSGLRISVPFRLNVHSEVEIRVEGVSVVGIVRNCTCIRANEFRVGVALRPAGAADEQFLHHLRLLRRASTAELRK